VLGGGEEVRLMFMSIPIVRLISGWEFADGGESFRCRRRSMHNVTTGLHLTPRNHFTFIHRRYVEEDLKKGLGKEPAKVLSARPMDDPLEIIMYMTR